MPENPSFYRWNLEVKPGFEKMEKKTFLQKTGFFGGRITGQMMRCVFFVLLAVGYMVYGILFVAILAFISFFSLCSDGLLVTTCCCCMNQLDNLSASTLKHNY
jgi:hypothetical protein